MLRLDFINVGYGDAVLIRDLSAPFCMLVDCGDVHVGSGGDRSRRISAAHFLKRSGIQKLDLLVVTHLHSDHVGGLAQVVSFVSVAKFWCNVLPPLEYRGKQLPVPAACPDGARCLIEAVNVLQDALAMMQRQGTQVMWGEMLQDRVQLTPDLNLILAAETDLNRRQYAVWQQVFAGGADAALLMDLDQWINDTSLRLRLNFGRQRVMLPGDVRAVYWINRDPQPCDILKLPHHGHLDGMHSELLDRLKPADVVISVSNSRTDACPAPDIVRMLITAGSRVHFTDAVRCVQQPPEYRHAVRFELDGEGGVQQQSFVFEETNGIGSDAG